MVKFISLRSHTGPLVCVNLDRIDVMIEEEADIIHIKMSGGSRVTVKESLDAIFEMIEEEERHRKEFEWEVKEDIEKAQRQFGNGGFIDGRYP